VKFTARLICFSVLTSIAVSSLMSAVLMLGGESRATVASILQTPSDIFAVLMIGAVIPLPISIPAGFIGGMLALHLLHSERRPFSLARWTRAGSIRGTIVGLSGTFVVESIAMQVRPEVWDFAPGRPGRLAFLMAILGAFTGAVIGAIVGTYCWKLMRCQRPEGHLCSNRKAAEHAH